MSRPITSAKITLTYPLYASDFDPETNNLLLVGGGGGEGRSGVSNKIVGHSTGILYTFTNILNYTLQTLLNSSKRQDLSEVVDIDLSRNEDSVTSLAYAQSTKQWATAFAGINSSNAEQQKGKNEHLRSFLIQYPSQRNADNDKEDEKTGEFQGETKALGKASLFSPSTSKTKETFQRVLRLSKKRKDNGPRLGVVATGLASEGEIVLFKADTSRPGKDNVLGRIALGKEEAADVDTVDLDENEETDKFRVAYCTDYGVYYTDVDYSQKDNGSKSECIYSTPHPDTSASSKVRPKFRSIRFITPKIFLILQNKPNGTGSELMLLDTTGRIIIRKPLHKKIKSATALSVAHLDSSPESAIDQHVIAIAGADTSITILTLDRFISKPKGRVKFRKHTFLPSVHPTSITSLTFSTFHRPTTDWNKTPAQYIKLASTSIANTCMVHTLPLSPTTIPPKSDAPARYILPPPPKSNLAQNTFSTIVAIIAIAIGAFFLQAFTEIRGGVPEYLGAKGWLSQGLHDWIARPYMFEDGLPSSVNLGNEISGAANVASEAAAETAQVIRDSAAQTQERLGLRDLLAQRNIGSDTSDNANTDHEIVVSDHPSSSSSEDGNGETTLSANLIHTDELSKDSHHHHKAKRWEDLAEHEKAAWKQRLIEAGQWTFDEGEAVLKGVLFSGLAGLVGGVVG
ncbi:hypothetical protein ACLMJK_009337 [Lecanora helva]